MKHTRRNVLAQVMAGSALAVGATTAAAQTAPVVLRVASASPAGSQPHLVTQRYVSQLNAAGGAFLRAEMVSTDADGPALLAQLHEGKLDVLVGSPAAGYARAPALGLWESTPTFGMDGHLLGAWHYYGGGAALLAQAHKAAGLNVVSFPFLASPTRPLGWFKKPVVRATDLKGVKVRATGLAAELYREMGADVKTTAPQRAAIGIVHRDIDAADLSDVSTDRILHIDAAAGACMLQSFHAASALLDVCVSGRRWETLSAVARALIEQVAHAMGESGYLEMAHNNALDYDALVAKGVKFYKTPVPILQAQLNAWDRVMTRLSASNPLFGQVVRSQFDFARTVVPWKHEIEVDFRIAHFYYFKSALV